MTASFASLAAESRLLVIVGAGGVGKTTVAACIGAALAADCALSVLVVTVDPARRLATALGLDTIESDTAGSDTEVVVDDAVWAAARERPTGQLTMAMLDTKASWDRLVRRHAPDARTRDAILANPLYANVTAKFIASHDYIAAERLHELAESDRYDLVIIDTPPSRQAIDFLDAPRRMREFFASRLLRWLTAPYRSKLVTAASKPFFAVADRILGAQFLSDIAEFFILLRTMEKGFVQRAAEVEATLRADTTGFVLVTTLDQAPAREAARFVVELEQRSLRLAALVLNQVLPMSLVDDEAIEAARRLHADRVTLAVALATEISNGTESTETIPFVLDEIVTNHGNLARAVAAQRRVIDGLEHAAPLVRELPALDFDIADLSGALILGRALVSGEGRP